MDLCAGTGLMEKPRAGVSSLHIRRDSRYLGKGSSAQAE